MVVAEDRIGRDDFLEQMSVIHLPIIKACSAGQGHVAVLRRRFGERAAGPGLAAREPPPRWLTGDVREQLARFAAGPPAVRAEPQFDPTWHRRPQLAAPALPV